jgi:parallel beta-helix repeat protein
MLITAIHKRLSTAFGSVPSFLVALALIILCASLASQPAVAETLCVVAAAKQGCYATIEAAVIAAAPHDTIEVHGGTYKESVLINKAVSLVAVDRHEVVIDATGLSNGIYVDGIDNTGLNRVSLKGFTIRNANFEGILVTNASSVTIFDNRVVDNDKSLQIGPPSSCPGIPTFETLEALDCGEAIHLSGVSHAIVANNIVENNTGGILLSDDTGATHDNLITGNLVRNNPLDCGITLASHPPAGLTGTSNPLGVFRNTISANESSANGLAAGEGAGVGIFASVPGAQSYGNVVTHNRLIGNGLPGVAMHGHTLNQNLNDNVIVGNLISGNAKDTLDAATQGPTGINVFGVSTITGTIIAKNVISNEAIAVAVNTPGAVDLHLNDVNGIEIGIDDSGSGGVDATENWWGCAGGPGAAGCANVNIGAPAVVFSPWLTSPIRDGRDGRKGEWDERGATVMSNPNDESRL